MATEALTMAAGDVTSALNARGLCALFAGVLIVIGDVVAWPGTRTDSTVALEDTISLAGTELLKYTALFAPVVSKELPTIVTIVPGAPAGGEMNSMRGPPGLAIRCPVNVPCALLLCWLQLPLAVSSVVLSARSCQEFFPQGGRSRVPGNLLPLPAPDTIPSMQSTSPISVPLPETPLVSPERVASHVPVTGPRAGSTPCQLPDQAPDRSGGGGGDEEPASPPPPQPVSAARVIRAKD